MAYDNFSAAPQRARNAVDRLTELGVKLPPAVTKAYATQQRLAVKPPAPQSRGLRDALLDGADRDELQAIALAELTAPAIESARLAAHNRAAAQVLDAIEADAEAIHRQLVKLATAAIAKLTAAAEVGDVPLDRLVRDGRHSDAEAIASAEVVARQLEHLYGMRDKLLWDRARPVLDCTRWTDPRYAGMGFVQGLQRGGRLWFPDKQTAMARADELARADDTDGDVDGAA